MSETGYYTRGRVTQETTAAAGTGCGGGGGGGGGEGCHPNAAAAARQKAMVQPKRGGVMRRIIADWTGWCAANSLNPPEKMSAGCVSWCDSIDRVVNGNCSGIGCCQTSIPKGVKDFLVDIRSFRNHTMVHSFNPCGYAFVAETEAFEFSSSDLNDLQNRKTLPVVLDWAVGNVSCQEARKDLSRFACRATHSECSDSSNGVGYHFKCLTGFQGNPYLVDGCQDIDECIALKPCEGTCPNLQGSYSCSCPKGFEGDGKKDGAGCHPKSQINGSTLFYIASGSRK